MQWQNWKCQTSDTLKHVHYPSSFANRLWIQATFVSTSQLFSNSNLWATTDFSNVQARERERYNVAWNDALHRSTETTFRKAYLLIIEIKIQNKNRICYGARKFFFPMKVRMLFQVACVSNQGNLGSFGEWYWKKDSTSTHCFRITSILNLTNQTHKLGSNYWIDWLYWQFLTERTMYTY